MEIPVFPAPKRPMKADRHPDSKHLKRKNPLSRAPDNRCKGQEKCRKDIVCPFFHRTRACAHGEYRITCYNAAKIHQTSLFYKINCWQLKKGYSPADALCRHESTSSRPNKIQPTAPTPAKNTNPIRIISFDGLEAFSGTVAAWTIV